MQTKKEYNKGYIKLVSTGCEPMYVEKFMSTYNFNVWWLQLKHHLSGFGSQKKSYKLSVALQKDCPFKKTMHFILSSTYFNLILTIFIRSH